jgi:alginate O-acetyltransferase complex protein AlgI
MIFLSYDFAIFALVFFCAYGLARNLAIRPLLIIAGGITFQAFYGGIASLIPVLLLTAASFYAGRSGNRILVTATIVLCVATLLFYKYTLFLAGNLIAPIAPGFAIEPMARTIVPAVIPLGISFFTFEFVHYLIEVRRGHAPLKRLREFLAFALFWPTLVAGPIKRYQQFVPALHSGIKHVSSSHVAYGIVRIAIGFVKKCTADNLTGWIDYMEPQLAAQALIWRWAFLVGLAFRILLDFSGYSDMAIGYARMMGIVVPENFNWPYLACSPMEFWQRWHMSLSLWIRDYIYIPLGGGRLGLPRRTLNAFAAMMICGLWHGAAWNFVLWGFYHGAGLGTGATLQRLFSETPTSSHPLVQLACWTATMLFVMLGWLLFFYPVDKALSITALLVGLK